VLSADVIQKLKNIVGDDGIFDRTEDLLAPAAEVEDAGPQVDVRVSPKTADEVARVLAVASEHGVPVVPRGSGTGPSGSSAAREGDIVLSTARMNRILSISAEDLIAVVQPGVEMEEFRRTVEEAGLFYPPDASSERPSTIGGSVGESTSGLRALKYGGTRKYVMGMKIALPTGERIQTGARTLKCVTGYDLARLFIGSLGTLGVCTEVYLKLLPLPETRVVTVAIFDRARDAAEASMRILDRGIVPSALEMMDRTTLQALLRTGDQPFPEDAGTLLLIETDGLPGAAGRQAVEAGEICHSSGARDVRKAQTSHAAEAFWNARRSALAALCRARPATVMEEVRVPRSRVADLVGSLMALVEIEAAGMALLGHVGEGRLHPTIPVHLSDPSDVSRVRRIVGKISQEVLSLGGRFGPERGVGLGDVSFLDERPSAEGMDLVKRLKDAFDPKGIMNPGARL
jgi:glycolate oxidase